MARIVPSAVVYTIDAAFPNAKIKGNHIYAEPQAGELQCMVSMVRQIPDELFGTINQQEYAKLMLEVGRVEFQLRSWLQQGQSTVDHLSRHKSVEVIREILSQCPDEYPPATTTELAFIADPDLRESIRNDIGAANRALANGEWKAATILAGAATEALLHWRLSQPSVTAAQISAARVKLGKPSSANIDDWGLSDFEVAPLVRTVFPLR